MISHPIINVENQRLQELLRYHILDSGVEQEFDELVQIAAKLLQAPAAAIVFMDHDRQWVKARKGLHFCELSRDVSICSYTILQDELMEIEDLRADERFGHFPYVMQDPSYRYYAGVPLITENGFRIGVFYIMDKVARRLDNDARNTLAMLAKQAMRQVELRLRNLELENLNKQQRHISSRLSHDIKNPLSNIKMMLDMQTGDELPENKEETDQFKGMLSQQVGNTINMLNNMVKWGNLQLGGERDAVQWVNLRQLACEAIDEIVMQSNAKGNVVVNAIPAGMQAQVPCEGVRFALRNLLTNANKFTSEGCITISHECINGKHYMYVADTGVGMTEEQTAKLNNNTSTHFSYGTNNEKGNGLGLGLLQDYLAKRDGWLHFQSKAGKGTKAAFTL